MRTIRPVSDDLLSEIERHLADRDQMELGTNILASMIAEIRHHRTGGEPAAFRDADLDARIARLERKLAAIA